VVVVTALAREDLIVTSDSDDLRKLATAIGHTVSLHVV
jgi:hypothetical protein